MMAWPCCERSQPFGTVLQPAERLGVLRLLLGDLVDRVVLDDAPARHVALARLPLAPGRDGFHHGEFGRLAQPHLQPLPGVVRMQVVGLARFEDVHFLRQPLRAAFALELAP